MTKTVEQIIEALGGAPVIAEAIKTTAGAVRLWKHRNIIPRAAWPDLIDAFPDKVTMQDLRGAEPPKPAAATTQNAAA